MLKPGERRFEALAKTIDDYVTLDITGVGLIRSLYAARMRRQQGPMCLKAAELIVDRLKDGGRAALIVTGFPEGGGVPETDGPIGAAMLARALHVGLGVNSVILTDENWRECVCGACRGAGLAPMPVAESGRVETIESLRAVFVHTVPKEQKACYRESERILEKMNPGLIFAIERPGMNDKGVYHGLSGRRLNELTADLDYLVRKAQASGVPLVGFGDGGNELGMGAIGEDLPSLLPKAADCGCGCGGGIGSATAAELLVVASVSNWGVTGVIAALALLLGNPNILHDAEHEIRSIELCTTFGGVDGLSMSPEAAVDGISAREWEGLIRAMKGIVIRGMGLNRDWRQLK